MIRQEARRHGLLAGRASGVGGTSGALRQEGARRGAAIGLLLLMPFAALAAALSGLVFVALLPVCGLASVAEAIARAAWRTVRRAVALRVRA